MRWSGHLLHLQEAREEFIPYFIVGEPAKRELKPAYQKAVEALRASPNNPKVYAETELDELVETIEDEMRHHDEHSSQTAN